jgi:ribonuclease HII
VLIERPRGHARMRIRPDWALERELWGKGLMAVAGLDEVGVGALAGPVVAAAVILGPGMIIEGLADSKLLTAKRRQALFVVIGECAVAIGLGRAEVAEIDQINVYWAAMAARRRAVEALQVTPGHVLVDGKRRVAGCRFRRRRLSMVTLSARRSRQRQSWPK